MADVYHPINEHPWPDQERWIVAWWDERHGQWCGWRGFETREIALERIAAMRAGAPGAPFRLVREICTYTTEQE